MSEDVTKFREQVEKLDKVPCCPVHKVKMHLKETSKFQYPKGGNRLFWSCPQWVMGCTYVVGAHPNGFPLGTPADKETKKWRMDAHEAFDVLWKSGKMKRKEAYKWLQETMKMSVEEAQIGNFTIQQCKQVVAKAIEASLKG